jgi:hypothetical protein
MIVNFKLYLLHISDFSFSIRCLPAVPCLSFVVDILSPPPMVLPSRFVACSHAHVPGYVFTFLASVALDIASIRVDTANPIT